MAADQIVAVGLLTQADLDRLGETFARLYPVRDTPCYGDLLAAIDDADRELARSSAGHQSTGLRARNASVCP